MQVLQIEWSHVITVVLAIIGGAWSLVKSTNKKLDVLDKKINVLTERSIRMEERLRNIDQRLSIVEAHLMPKKVFHFEETHKQEPNEN